jgi:hypothetical protein
LNFATGRRLCCSAQALLWSKEQGLYKPEGQGSHRVAGDQQAKFFHQFTQVHIYCKQGRRGPPQQEGEAQGQNLKKPMPCIGDIFIDTTITPTILFYEHPCVYTCYLPTDAMRLAPTFPSFYPLLWSNPATVTHFHSPIALYRFFTLLRGRTPIVHKVSSNDSSWIHIVTTSVQNIQYIC